MSFNHSLTLGTLVLSLASAALVACGQPPRPPQGPTGTPKVGVLVLQPQRVAITTELPGRTAPYQVAEVRPQVTGLIQTRSFTEGSAVRAGALLYRIAPASYQAGVDTAQAALAKAQANAQSSRVKADRYRELAGVKAVGQQEADDAAAALAQAQADVASAQAALDSNRINLAYTQVTAPISGRIGRSAVTAGALVTANQATALATVQQLDPIYVDVTQSSASVLRLRRAFADGELQAADSKGAARVALLLEDGSRYAHSGTLQFAEVSVDQATGAITLRAVFPNPRGELLPGMYVRAVIEEGANDKALLVPQAAVSRDSAGKPTAYVVGEGSKLELRQLDTDRAVGDQWLVKSGLRAGERVVVDGQQGARPGMAVEAVPYVREAPRAVTNTNTNADADAPARQTASAAAASAAAKPAAPTVAAASTR